MAARAMTRTPAKAAKAPLAKVYYRIGEVAQLVGVKPTVLRYWESEFPTLKPTKSKTQQRLYRLRDVEMVESIKQLLYDEGLTIDGARKRLREIKRSAKPARQPSIPVGERRYRTALVHIRKEIETLQKMLG